jgi:hypothetical protein
LWFFFLLLCFLLFPWHVIHLRLFFVTFSVVLFLPFFLVVHVHSHYFEVVIETYEL